MKNQIKNRAKLPPGRPKITLDFLKKKWDKQIPYHIQKYGSWPMVIQGEMAGGASLIEIQVLLDISDSLFERLMEEEESFYQSVKRGLNASEAWWVREGRENLKNKYFNAVLWYMNMKNRFGWKDKHDFTSNGEKVNIGVVFLPPREKELLESKKPKVVVA